MVDTTQDIVKDISEQIQSIVGKLNTFDSKKERLEIAQSVLNGIVAGIEASKLEKAGLIAYLNAKRVQ